MPEFFKQNLLTKVKKDSENLLESPLETKELPQSEDSPFDQFEHYYEDNLVKTLVSWKAASRPYRKKDRSFYTTVAILITLVSLIAVLAGERMLIGALFALGFLVYVLNFIPPEETDYRLSTQGVTIGGDHFYHWDQLDSFWFSEKDGFKTLNILTMLRFPALLILVLGDTDQEEIKKICARYLPFHEIAPKTMIDKWSEGLQKHFPLENPHR